MFTGIALSKKDFARRQIDNFQLSHDAVKLIGGKIRKEWDASQQIGGHVCYCYFTTKLRKASKTS
jgi:hypothetical protein